MKKITSEKKTVVRFAATKEEQARNAMYAFFKSNRASMPANITTQREFILARLVDGAEVAETFAEAIARANALVEIRHLPKFHLIQVKRSSAKAA
jgi:hypothetical protein